MNNTRTNKAVHNLGNIQRCGEINGYLELFSPVRNFPQLNELLGAVGNELRAVRFCSIRQTSKVQALTKFAKIF